MHSSSSSIELRVDVLYADAYAYAYTCRRRRYNNDTESLQTAMGRTVVTFFVLTHRMNWQTQIRRFERVLPFIFSSCFSLLLSPKQELSFHCLSLVCLLFSLFLWCVGVLWIVPGVTFWPSPTGGKKNIWYLFFHLIGQMIDVFI